MAKRTKAPRPENAARPEEARVVVPFPARGKQAGPDRVEGEILDYMRHKLRTKDGKSLVEESLGTSRLEELARTRTYEDLKRITDNVYASVYWLHDGKFHHCVNVLLEPATLEQLYSALPYKSAQLSMGLFDLCGRGEEFAAVVEMFFTAVMANLDARIVWKPMVDELMARDGVSATSYFMGEELPAYLQKWDERVALLDEAIARWGLREYAQFMSGGRAVELEEGANFSTTSDGRIFAPSYASAHDTKEANLTSIKISVVHECGHHKWRTFRLNLHPDALHLEIVGARFAGETHDAGARKHFIIQAKDKQITVKSYRDVMKVVKYPKLLAFLHNVADDKRVDTLNMLDNEALADEYAADIALLLQKRPDLKGCGLGDMLEALLQQTVAGTSKNEVPAGLRAKLGKCMEDLAAMEIHDASDGTDSLNVALRWYATLEPDMDELASRVTEQDDKADLEDELTKMLPKSFSGSDTSMEDGGVELSSRKPEKIVIKHSDKRRTGQRRPGIDPLAFLDLKPRKGGEGEGDGEPCETEPGEEPQPIAGPEGDGKPKPAAGTEPQSPEEQPGKSHSYDEWSGTGYRRMSKKVVEHPADGALVHAPAHLRKRVESMFRKYAPKEGELVRGLDSGEPDPELEARYHEDVDAGHFPEPNYHADVVYQRTNVALSVNIDFSQSMDESAGSRKKLDVALEGAAVIACAGAILRYPTEVSGFCGGERVEYYLMPADKNGVRIPLQRDGSGTPMAGAVRHSTTRTLQMRRLRHKRFAYQFWLCDAQPNCSGEGIDATVDTSKAVQEARAKGIRLFGIIIADEKEKAKMEEAYRKIFGGGWYVVVTTAEAMMHPLLKFMQRVAIVNR